MQPPLTRSDAALLAALTERGSRWRTLTELLHDADWVNCEIPTFDEVTFGLPRLMANDLAEVREGNGFRPTSRATALRRSVQARTLAGVVVGVGMAVGAKPYAQSEVEDRSLGRLKGLTEAAVDAAVLQNERWFRFWSWPIRATLTIANAIYRILRRA